MYKKWTKKEAIEDFKQHYMPAIRAQEEEWGGGVDVIFRCESWNNYTDYLCKDGLISDHQYMTWVHPSICG